MTQAVCYQFRVVCATCVLFVSKIMQVSFIPPIGAHVHYPDCDHEQHRVTALEQFIGQPVEWKITTTTVQWGEADVDEVRGYYQTHGYTVNG